MIIGALHISNPIGRQTKGLAYLNLSHCCLTSKGVNLISHSLTVNKFMNQTLSYLNLAGNSLKDDVNNLFNFLAQPNVLTTLDLSGTDCAVDALFGALLRGCTTHLATLKLSRNNFSVGGGSSGGGSGGGGVVGGGGGGKKSREMLPSFKQFFTSTLALKTISLAHCKLPPDALKQGVADPHAPLTKCAPRNVLLGLACNESLSSVEVDLSSNHLGSAGAQILESCIHGVHCLGALHLHDNGAWCVVVLCISMITVRGGALHLHDTDAWWCVACVQQCDGQRVQNFVI
ncbi:Leucine-rich repeat [Trinorchestia longiramus]|nr:Leucine-rich repeat [Trinorchestia longiramus]